MTWFGWVMVAVYVASMLITTAAKTKAGKADGAALTVLVSLVMIACILTIGTGTGV